MSAYIVTDNELVAIANAIRTKNSSNQVFTIDQIPTAIASIGENVGTGAVTRTANGNSYIINETKLTAIANAIRTKLDNNNQMTVAQMPGLIDSIEISQYKEISDSWDTIITNIDNGTYKTKYTIGDYKPLDLGTEGIINMQIVAMDADELADETGYAPLTFIGMELLKTSHRMNPTRYGSSGAYREGTGTIGGWGLCEMRTYLKNTVKPLIPSAVRSRINSVIKYSRTFDIAGSLVNNASSIDDVWVPSRYEIFGASTYAETQGPIYSSIFPNDASHIKSKVGTSSASWWWLRSAAATGAFYNVKTNGSDNNPTANTSGAVALGFCLGLEQETITDDWSTILTNSNYATDYSIGDTKSLNLGTEGRQLMEIVAFDTDDKADGTGKAKITWISKGLLNNAYYTNSANGIPWSDSQIRSTLQSTIKALIPDVVRNHIVSVTKTSYTAASTDAVTSDDIWLPSARELNLGYTSNQETTGVTYSNIYTGISETRKKKHNGVYSQYWLRSMHHQYTALYKAVTNIGGETYGNYMASKYIAIGFCTN